MSFLKSFFVFCLCLINSESSSSFSQTPEDKVSRIVDVKRFSIVGVSLGMSETDIEAAIFSEFKPPKQEVIPDDKLSLVITYGSEKCGWAIAFGQATPCIRFSSFLYKLDQTEVSHKAAIISLEQYFENPIQIETFRSQILKSYGQPNVQIDNRTDLGQKKDSLKGINQWSDGKAISPVPFAPRVIWIWSDELNKIEQNDRAKLLDGIPYPGEVGITKPILRLFVNSKGGLIYGMKIFAIDPASLKLVNAVRHKSETEKSKLKNLQDGEQIKLK